MTKLRLITAGILFFTLLFGCTRKENKTIDAFSLIQAEKFDTEIGKVDNLPYDGIPRFEEVRTYSVLRSFNKGDTLLFKNVDFKDGARSLTMNLAQNWGDKDGEAKLEFRIDQKDGKLIARVEIDETGGWEHYEFQSSNIETVKGVHDLYLIADHIRGAGDIDWFTFSKFTLPESSLKPALKEVKTSTLLKSNKKYYIDSKDGNDRNDGRSPDRPWKSHTMISGIKLKPGDIVAFKAGSQFTGPVVLSDSGTEKEPILFTSYGEGPKPRFTNPDDTNLNGNCFRIFGSWLIVEKLHFHDTPPTKIPSRLKSIFLTGAVLNAKGADHNIIRNNDFINVTKGIQSTGEHTLITGNYLIGVDHSLWWNGGFGSWGPMGIQLGIGNQEVSYNVIKNFLSTESGYGSDGGAIELDDGRYHKNNVYIHHNYSEGNAGFLESSWTHDYNPFVQEVHNLRVAFNISYDGQNWLFMWAPCHDCYFDNNTVVRINDFRSPLYDVVLADFEGINFRNNFIAYTEDPFTTNKKQKLQHNWYLNFNHQVSVYRDSLQAGSGNPLMIDMINGNFNLSAESPLRGKGLNLGDVYRSDFNGNRLPETENWDIGALQYVENAELEKE